MAVNGQSAIRPATFHYRAGDIEPEHSHPEHQLIYADRGVLNVETNSSRWVVPPLRALWVPANIPHTIVAKADSEMATLYLSRSATLCRPGIAVIYVSPLLRELIRYIHRNVSAGPARGRLEAVILDQLETAAAAPPLHLPQLQDPRARTIAEALDHNPTDQRTLREFGREVGAHERTLQRIFAAETGTTFGQWRTQLRLQHAIVALTQGHSVTSAAARCGYRESSAFIAAFRSAFGTTPGRYLRETAPN